MLTVGATVHTRDQRRNGHTRLPRYLQDARGVVVAVLGSFPLPDEVVVDSRTARKSRLYTVAFPSSTIFAGDAAGTICADLFEDYLEVEA
jgi:nitrile hydratase subunit beta